jgi:ADP-heptose:LPS heptosyltransferase
MVKFLVIRFSSIGDIVLTTPAVRCLKKQVEDAQVHFAVKKQFAPIILANPYIEKVHQYDSNLSELLKELRKEEFDYIIDLHHNIRSFMVKSCLGALPFSFDKLNLKKWLLVVFKINILPDVHIVDRYLGTLRIFDVKNDYVGLDYFIPKKDEIDIATLPPQFQSGYTGFAIGAKHNTKKLTVGKIISVCKGLDSPVILLGGIEDIESGNHVVSGVGEKVFNACGKYNINQSASLVRQSELIISHDTGLMHIAAAFKKKIISIWGNTVPEFGMYPYLPDPASEIVGIEDLPCRPCSKLGYRKCPKGHFKCINEVNIERVIDLANKLFKKENHANK